MSDDSKFWIAIWMGGVALLALLIASCTTYQLYEVRAVKQLILNGNDPMEVRCAYEVYDRAICGIVAARK